MLKDLGFFDISGNYIEDIQEIDMEEFLPADGRMIKKHIQTRNTDGTWKEPEPIENEIIKRLEQENARLKEENIKFTLETKKLISQYSEKIKDYKQALEEIKRITDKLGYTSISKICDEVLK